ncbi:MAG: hypothetical protein S4CHLAM7_01440 [Chlamydiae bacterium]|nr:hypothetical protein [Chlamydiota bacterium]
MRIWSRYIRHQFLKIFFLLIFSFYFVYILIDYSSRLDYFTKLPALSILIYYLHLFVQKADLLLPFAFMIALIKVLLSINEHNELTSMLMSGLTYKKLLSPLLYTAIILTVLLYANFEFLEPMAQKRIETIKQKKRSKRIQVHSFVLDDSTKIVFWKFDLSKNSLEEVYWLKSSDHIYYMKELYPYSKPPIGHYVLEFKRNANDNLELVDKIDLRPFKEMALDFNPLIHSVFSIRTYSISSLIKALNNPKILANVNKHELLTLLNFKLLLPLLPLMIYMALVPICTRFSRNTPTFLIYMIAIGTLLSFITLIDACYFLGETKSISPQLIMWIPALLYFFYPIKKFYTY